MRGVCGATEYRIIEQANGVDELQLQRNPVPIRALGRPRRPTGKKYIEWGQRRLEKLPSG